MIELGIQVQPFIRPTNVQGGKIKKLFFIPEALWNVLL